MKEQKIHRLWKPVSFGDKWENADTSILDDISPSWIRRRKILEGKSKEYAQFIDRLKREHAIETGIIENLYDLKKGITETFIINGFRQSYLSHGDTNISEFQLMDHLRDHLESVDFIFDVVKENRPLTVGFIKALHQLVTRNQKNAEGRDQFGRIFKIELLKGDWKVRENNPTNSDGTIIRYCPPEHVVSEMDNLVEIYNDLVEQEIHPLIISTWFHHAFTTIHSFQDGNGRVARLLSSLIFIKYNFFPITVLREQGKVDYINALEKADNREPQELISLFARLQKNKIDEALDIQEVSSDSLEVVTDVLAEKLNKRNEKYIDDLKNEKEAIEEKERLKERLLNNWELISEYCFETLEKFEESLKNNFNGNVRVHLKFSEFADDLEDKRKANIKKIRFQINPTFQNSGYSIEVIISRWPDYTATIAGMMDGKQMPVNSHRFAIEGEIELRKKNIKSYLENLMTIFLSEIANDL